MSDSIYIRLSNIMDDLARLARHVQPLEMQLALEHLVDRLDAVVELTMGWRRRTGRRTTKDMLSIDFGAFAAAQRRFWSKVVCVNSASETCWHWLAQKDKDGSEKSR